MIDLSGQSHEIPGRSQPTVLLFLSPDCPIANRYVPEIKRLLKEFNQRVDFFVVYVGYEVSAKEAKQHVKEFGLPVRGLLDPQLKLVHETGVTVSPEAAVVSAKGVITYRGRIDDLYDGHGTRRAQVNRRDLAIAVQETLANKKVTKPMIPATGCFLPQK